MRKSVALGGCAGAAALAAGTVFVCMWFASSSLHRAAADGDAHAVQRLLNTRHRAQINRPKGLFLGYAGNNLTPLMWAARKGHPDTVSALLTAGAVVDKRDEFGRTALWLAAQYGTFECIDLLLQHGANPNERSSNGAPILTVAVRRGNLPCVSRLLEGGADPNIVGSAVHDGQTALSEAVDRYDIDMVRCLLRAGADPREATVGKQSLVDYVADSTAPDMEKIQVLMREHEYQHRPRE